MILRRVGRSHRKGLHSGRKAARLSYFARGSPFISTIEFLRKVKEVILVISVHDIYVPPQGRRNMYCVRIFFHFFGRSPNMPRVFCNITRRNQFDKRLSEHFLYRCVIALFIWARVELLALEVSAFDHGECRRPYLILAVSCITINDFKCTPLVWLPVQQTKPCAGIPIYASRLSHWCCPAQYSKTLRPCVLPEHQYPAKQTAAHPSHSSSPYNLFLLSANPLRNCSATRP